MKPSIWRVLGILALVACLVTLGQAQDAKCTSGDYAWANNKEGKDPCQLANALVSKCNAAPFPMLPLNTAMYGGPGENTECLCNLVEYNLLRVCAKCQTSMEAWVEEFPEWGKNCASKDKVEFGPGAPDGVNIPAWARAGSIAGPWSLDPLKAAAAPPSPPSPPPQQPPSPSPPAERPSESQRAQEAAVAPLETSSQRNREPEPTSSARQAANNVPEQGGPSPQQQETKRPDPSPPVETPKSSDPPLRKLLPSKAPDRVDNPAPISTFDRPVQPQRPVEPIQPILLSPLRKEPTPSSTVSVANQDDDEETSNDDNAGNRGIVGIFGNGNTASTSDRPFKQTSQFEDLANTRQLQAASVTASPFTPKNKNPSTTSRLPLDTAAVSLVDDDALASDAISLSRGQYAGKAANDLSALLIGSATQLNMAEQSQVSGAAPLSLDNGVDIGAMKEGQKEQPDEDESPRSNTVFPSVTGEAGFIGAGSYQYSGDPGVEVDESDNSDSKTKVAIVCGTLAAVLVAAAVAFKLFTCFRKRKDLDDDNAADDRESWMEPEASESGKSEQLEKPEVSSHSPIVGLSSGRSLRLVSQVVYPKGILGRQSVWDRIQRSLMPAISRVSANPAPYPSFNSSTPAVQPEISDQPASYLSEPYTPEATTPRRSIWANIRKSFGPFGRPSFVPPVPTPNLAALRGLNRPDALRPGILKRNKPEAQFDSMQNSPVETLHYDDEEAIRHRDVYNNPLPMDIAYAGGYQTEPRQWI